MLNILKTSEVAAKIGKSVRRTQELIGEGVVFPRLEIWENGVLKGLGVRKEVLDTYLKSQTKKR